MVEKRNQRGPATDTDKIWNKNDPVSKKRTQEAVVLAVPIEKIPNIRSKIEPGSGINSETGECVHHWILETEKGGMSFGRCKKCGVAKVHGDPENPYK